MESACSYSRHQGYVFLRGIAQREDWDGFLKAVTDAEEDFRSGWDQYGRIEEKNLLIQLVKRGEDAQSRLGDIHQTLQDFVSQLKQMRLDDQDRQDRQCLRDLFLVDPQDDLEKIEMKKDTLYDGAYQWILGTDEYASFHQLEQYRLCIVAFTHVDQGPRRYRQDDALDGHYSPSSRQPATYAPCFSHFFCQGTDETLNSATATLRSLIWLLLVQQPHLLPHLRSKHENAGSSLF